MTCERRTDTAELEHGEHKEDRVAVRGDGLLRSIMRGLFWPVGIVIRAYRGVWWALGFRQPVDTAPVISPARHSLAGRKRLHRVTRFLLTVLPRWLQAALGYPVSSSIGRSLSPEVRVSPTKPCGKGSKRKQDELDEDDEDDEEEQQTWVEALTQELSEDLGPEEDPDYEPSTVDTESEEYCSHNNTESDIEVQGKGVVIIEDVETGLSTPTEVSCPAV